MQLRAVAVTDDYSEVLQLRPQYFWRVPLLPRHTPVARGRSSCSRPASGDPAGARALYDNRRQVVLHVTSWCARAACTSSFSCGVPGRGELRASAMPPRCNWRFDATPPTTAACISGVQACCTALLRCTCGWPLRLFFREGFADQPRAKYLPCMHVRPRMLRHSACVLCACQRRARARDNPPTRSPVHLL